MVETQVRQPQNALPVLQNTRIVSLNTLPEHLHFTWRKCRGRRTGRRGAGHGWASRRIPWSAWGTWCARARYHPCSCAWRCRCSHLVPPPATPQCPYRSPSLTSCRRRSGPAPRQQKKVVVYCLFKVYRCSMVSSDWLMFDCLFPVKKPF